MHLDEEFPWHRHLPGESFFVPALLPDDVMRRGLAAGRQHFGQGARISARFGVVNGLLGVLFTVRR